MSAGVVTSNLFSLLSSENEDPQDLVAHLSVEEKPAAKAPAGVHYHITPAADGRSPTHHVEKQSPHPTQHLLPLRLDVTLPRQPHPAVVAAVVVEAGTCNHAPCAHKL